MNTTLVIKVADLVAAFLSFLLAKYFFSKEIFPVTAVEINFLAGILSSSLLFFTVALGSYKTLDRKFDSSSALQQAKILTCSLASNSLLILAFSKSLNFFAILPPCLFYFSLSLVARALQSSEDKRGGHLDQQNSKTPPVNVLIYGAGEAGQQIAKQCVVDGRYCLKGYLDDDKNLQGKTLHGVVIYAPRSLEEIRVELKIDEIFVAIPSATPKRYREIIDFLSEYRLKLKTLPSLVEIISNQVGLKDIKDIKVEDVLLRAPVHTDKELTAKKIEGRVVLVTGAAGSIGSELCRIIVEQNPKHLLLLDFSEYGLYKIQKELSEPRHGVGENGCKVTPILLSAADQNGINQCFEIFRPEIVFHAAAYKHVSFVEENLYAGLKNNIWGTYAVVNASLKFKASDFILISTDKAVRPTSVMGASKRICELIVQGMSEWRSTEELKPSTCFSIVRFGNVLGSSGSVVPLFMERLKQQKPLVVRHRDVTRYFMTIREAAQLVLAASALAAGGEVFVLDMGEPIKIYELAKKMIELHGLDLKTDVNPDGTAEIEITELLPGEKLYEELLIGNSPVPTSHPKILKASEEHIRWSELERRLERLHEWILKFDAPNIYRELKQMIPEFTHADNPSDHLYAKNAKDIKFSDSKSTKVK